MEKRFGAEKDAIREALGRTNVIDSLDLASPTPRTKERFVHPDGFPENANVWRFVIAGEAFLTEETTPESFMIQVDRVFSGEHNPALPVVTYDWLEVNGEPVVDPD